MKFNCIKCGLCCTKIGETLSNLSNVPEPYRSEFKDFPYTADESGCCEKYDKETKRCTVYSTRPLICNIERLYIKYYQHLNLPKKLFYDYQASACNKIILSNAENENDVQLVQPH